MTSPNISEAESQDNINIEILSHNTTNHDLDFALAEQRRLQMERNLQLKPVKPRPTKICKHTSRACLECRSRHSKCDGKLPVCSKCLKRNKVCVYVESKRGGSRKKGVSKKKSKKVSGSSGQGQGQSQNLKESSEKGTKAKNNGNHNNNNNNSNPLQIRSLAELSSFNLVPLASKTNATHRHYNGLPLISRTGSSVPLSPSSSSSISASYPTLNLPCLSHKNAGDNGNSSASGSAGCSNLNCLGVKELMKQVSNNNNINKTSKLQTIHDY